MAVPFICLNVISPKEKMLFSITSLSAVISASFCLGHSSGTVVQMCFAMSMMAVLVGMFVYIETALAVKSCAVRWYCVEHSIGGGRSCSGNTILVVWKGFVIFSLSRCLADGAGYQDMQRLVGF